MPKIYFKSKDVQNVDVLQWNGVCYTRTGNYGTASKNSNIPLTDIIKFYGDCDTCEGGQVSLTPGTTSTVLSSTQSFQVLVPTLTSGQSTTLRFESDSTCDVVLSANAADQLVFDVNGVGNGPHVFANVGDTINFESCDVPPLTYDVTYAGTGSYILKFEQTTPALSANEGVDLEYTYEDIELSELTEQEQNDLIDTTNEIVAEEYDVEPAQVETTLEEGSIRAITRIRRLYKHVMEQIQAKGTSTLTGTLTSMIANSPSIRPAVKQKIIARVSTKPPLRAAMLRGDHNIHLYNHNTLCYKISNGKDLAGNVESRKDSCNPTLYMKDNESLQISMHLDQGVEFDMFDEQGDPLRGTTEHYSVSGLPASGHGLVNISLTPGFTGNIHYKETSGMMTGNPGSHSWSVPAGGNGKIIVKSTLPKPTPPYHPELRVHTRMPAGNLAGKSSDDVRKLAQSISRAVSGKMPYGSGDFKVYTSVTFMKPARLMQWNDPTTWIGTKATTNIVFPTDLTKEVYDLAVNLLNGGVDQLSMMTSPVSADIKQEIINTTFDNADMADNFSIRVYFGDVRRTKPVVMCAQDVKECWDGTYLSRDPNNNCEFPQCPPEPRWFTKLFLPYSSNITNQPAWIQLHGTKTSALTQYAQLTATQAASDNNMVVMKIKNTNCLEVAIDPLKAGIVAETDIPRTDYKLYRDYFYNWHRRRYFRNDWQLYASMSACNGQVIVDPVDPDPVDPDPVDPGPVVPDPTPTPTPTAQPVIVPDPVVPDPTPTPTPTAEPVIVSQTYLYDLTPVGSDHYNVQPVDGNALSYAGNDVNIGLQGDIKYQDTIELINTAHPAHPLALQVMDSSGNTSIHQISSDSTGKVSVNLRDLENTLADITPRMNNGELILVKYFCTAHPSMTGFIYINA